MTESEPRKRSSRAFLLFGAGFVSGVIGVGIVIFAFYFYSARLMSSPELKSTVSAGKFYDTSVALSLDRAEAELTAAKNEYDRWLALGDLAVFSVDTGKLNESEKYATELLKLSAKYQKDWNYGNAIHKGHIALGRIELRKNNLNGAAGHLIEAGKTPGSPQLDSFGPNMILAKELLEKGEREKVLEYLDLCGKFWKMHGTDLRQWKAAIKAGGMPSFGANLVY